MIEVAGFLAMCAVAAAGVLCLPYAVREYLRERKQDRAGRV